MHMNHASQSNVFYFVWKCHYVALFMLSRSIIVTISYSVSSEARTVLDRATTEVTEQVGKWQNQRAHSLKLDHTVNFGSEMVQALQVSRKNIFCSMNKEKIGGKRIFEIIHWTFQLPPNQHRPTGPFGWHKWGSLARPSKGQ